MVAGMLAFGIAGVSAGTAEAAPASCPVGQHVWYEATDYGQGGGLAEASEGRGLSPAEEVAGFRAQCEPSEDQGVRPPDYSFDRLTNPTAAANAAKTPDPRP
jgi:hypothetical protein